MKYTFALKIAAAGAAFAFAGCLGSDPAAERRQVNADNLKFIQESSAPLTARVSEGFPGGDDIAANLEKIGCPKLAQLFRDLANYRGDDVPNSFRDYLSCFGLSANPTIDELEAMEDKFQNPVELLNCICGGTGLSDYLGFTDFKFTAYQGTSSAAAGAAYSGKGSTGANYSGSSSAVSGGAYTGK